MIDPDTASASVDLGAYRRNLRRLAEVAGAGSPAAMIMAVVKADAYGHGMIACARAARAEGVPWLGVATPAEAVTLRAAGDTGRILCWLYGPQTALAEVMGVDVDVTASSITELDRIRAVPAPAPRRVQLKIDTGLSRNGCAESDWPALCAAAAAAERAGEIVVTGVWSHLAAADEPGHPSVPRQADRFATALAQARAAGLEPELAHLANSAGALILPDLRHDLVRVGIASYGVDPGDRLAASVGVTLEPVMTLRARLVRVKSIVAGEGVSYGHTWTATEPTTVGLVPLGYADGVPRHASNVCEVYLVAERRRVPIRGRICMDQFVVDLGADAPTTEGAEVIIFGATPPGAGTIDAPTAEEWAAACGTIGYEIVTRIGGRIARTYSDPGGSGA